MATLVFRGDAPTVYQVSTSTLTGTWSSGEVATVTINGKSITITTPAGGLTAAQMAAALAAAINGDAVTAEGETRNTTGTLIPEFSEITASVNSATLTLTGDTERPFTVTVAEDAGSGGFPSFTEATAADGPSHLSAANFTGGSLPGGSDTLVFSGSQACLYNLDALSAVSLTKVVFEAGFQDSGVCGLPNQTTNSVGTYEEYLPRYLELASGVDVEIGQGTGNGSNRIKVDLGGGNSTVTVYSTGTSTERDRHAVMLKNAGTSSSLYVSGGSVDVCREVGETATFATVRAAGNARVRLGAGCTLTTVDTQGTAQVDLEAGCTTLTVAGAARLNKYVGGITTLNAFGGTVNVVGSGTIGTTTLGAATLDLSQAVAGATFTNFTVASAGYTINDPGGRATFSNAIAFTGVSPETGTFQVGPGKSITVA